MPSSNRLKSAYVAFIGALLFTVGLILMGSTGPWWPWPNLAGAAIFASLIPFTRRTFNQEVKADDRR